MCMYRYIYIYIRTEENEGLQGRTNQTETGRREKKENSMNTYECDDNLTGNRNNKNMTERNGRRISGKKLIQSR